MHLYDIDDKALLKQEIDSADVLANATSVGMVPHQDSCLVEESDLHEGLYVFDCVYNPKDTAKKCLLKLHVKPLAYRRQI